jgi:DNA repair protein RecO (recombination protein O)
MKQTVTTGIVLKRTNFGEADRIMTVLTPDQGKVRLMAKGVRKIKSKLAGGVELFSISELSFIASRGELHTLISSRLQQHFANIVQSLDRTMLGYELLKRIDRATEDAADSDYFNLLNSSLAALDNGLDINLLELWFDARLLSIAGHQPNLATDASGQKLLPQTGYSFDFDSMSFSPAAAGSYTPAHIKFLRLVFGVTAPGQLRRVNGLEAILPACQQLVGTMRRQFIRI